MIKDITDTIVYNEANAQEVNSWLLKNTCGVYYLIRYFNSSRLDYEGKMSIEKNNTYYCSIREGDYISILKSGKITVQTEDVFYGA